MNQEQKQIDHAKLLWDEQGLPHSVAFDDKYFCAQDGMLESQYVFCGGNNLRKRFKNLSGQKGGTFTIGETGFGTGLNFLCAWQLWQQCAPKNWTLHYISIEHFPLNDDDLSKSLNLWPSLADYSKKLIFKYSNNDNLKQDMQFDEGRVKLTLILEDVLEALDQIREQNYLVDAWFLDGFAPSKNPEMWSQEVFNKMSQVSYSETTVSTFTSAGNVRRGLNTAGFEVEKVKGFGTKRHMLVGSYSS